MRIVITGGGGQVTRALQLQGQRTRHQIVAVGRPDLDLGRPATVESALAAARPDVIVASAAYSCVDQAETDRDTAFALNAVGAGAVAAAAARLVVPLIHLSTVCVFDGAKAGRYLETDAPAPISVYGQSKLEGEQRVADATGNHVILRLSWLYSPFGCNFVKTMLHLAEDHDSVRVVADQRGRPSNAFDVADAVLAIASRLHVEPVTAPRGVFHLSGAGATSWAGFASAIFAGLRARGGRAVTVIPIATADDPQPARRPANALLSGGKLFGQYGVTLPDWTVSLSRCLDRLIPELGPAVRCARRSH